MNPQQILFVSKHNLEEMAHIYGSKSKVKQSLYTPWRRLGGEEL
jgi:hypothetical protein